MELSQPRRSRVLTALATLAIAVVSVAGGQATRAATDDPVLLNEALVSHFDADTTEFVELFGTPGASLAGLALLAVEGDSAQTPGRVDWRLDFAATAHLGGNGYYLVGNPQGLAADPYGVTPDVAIDIDELVTQILENGSQTLALVEAASAPAVGGLVTGGEVVRDAVGVTDGGSGDQFYFGVSPNLPVVIGPTDAGFLPPGVSRSPVGWDTDTASDWVITSNSRDTSHTPTPASPYEPAPTPTPTPTPDPTPSEPTMEAFHVMLDAYVTAGDVAAGKALLLADRLARVDRYLASGQEEAAQAQLQAFAHQVTGMSPSWVAPAAAEALAEMADALSAALAIGG